jgi:hypothetical protein
MTGLIFTAAFLVPHTAVGVLFTGALMGELAMAMTGVPVDGRVTETVETHTRKGSTGCSVDYAYMFDGQGHSGTFWKNGRPCPKRGSPVHLRAFAWPGGTVQTRLSLENSGLSSWLGIAFAILWDSLVLMFHYLVWGRVLLCRYVMKHGTAVPGSLTAYEPRKADQLIRYGFSRDGLGCRGSMLTRVTGAAGFSLGESLTVVYLPSRPFIHFVYEASDWEVM